jgi:hypothetical protein
MHNIWSELPRKWKKSLLSVMKFCRLWWLHNMHPFPSMTSSCFTGGEGSGCRLLATNQQCKMGNELHDPEHAAWPKDKVGLSVWIGGKCRRYQLVEDGDHVPQTERHGWVLMGSEQQFIMLGVSISEALPEQRSCWKLGTHFH